MHRSQSASLTAANRRQADKGTYQFAYTLDANGNVTDTNVTDPRGYVRKVTFNSDGYMVSDTRAVGKPEQQAVTYNRQQGSGLVLSVTDALNHQTAYTYDVMGNTTSVTRLAGQVRFSIMVSCTDSSKRATLTPQ
jgi:YD repeat-containing protein